MLTATEAVRQIFPTLPTEFSGLEFAYQVRAMIGRPEMYADTALRKARLLFRDQFVLVNKRKSLYRKVPAGSLFREVAT